MVTAVCPGHITCFFKPFMNAGGDLLSVGSEGAGIRLFHGTTVEVTERSGSGSRITMDGEDVSAPVTQSVIGQIAPLRGFDVNIVNDLPCGEGFGMSAAGAVASALCLADICGLNEQQAFEVAHRAEIEGGGGLGDVSAIYCPSHQPVRIVHGLPPRGKVIDAGISFPRLSLIVLGSEMHTGSVLADSEKYESLVSAGCRAMESYLAHPCSDLLYAVSNDFSGSASVESPAVTEALEKLHGLGFSAAMCMLGNSIFTDAPAGELESVFENAQIFSSVSSDKKAKIIRKG